jgi:RNA polymerase sigma-54 factor
MDMTLNHNLNLSTELRLAPHIIQSIGLLALPVLEMQAFIQEQLDSNPILEQIEDTEEFHEEDIEFHSEGKQELDEENEIIEENEPRLDETIHDFENIEHEDWSEFYSQDKISKKDDGEKDPKMEAMQNSADRSASFQDYVFEQFRLLDIPDELQAIGEEIIYNLQSDGYLRDSLEELITCVDEPVSLEQAEEALSYIQQLDPPGVGARNLTECLILQLSHQDPDYEFKCELIKNHLEDIYYNRFPKIVKETGKSLEEINALIDSIRKLNPKPGTRYSNEPVQCIVPDVLVENINGQYCVRTNNKYVPKLRLNPEYTAKLQTDTTKAETPEQKFIKQNIEKGNWVITAIEQRQKTLQKVAEKTMEYQKDFLDHGEKALKPLKMQEIAEQINVNVSTVSRAIADKYIQTPRGIFPLKYFFTNSIKNSNDDETESRVSVQKRIQQLINQEDKKKPLSDEDLVDLLQKERGLDIARRTITKYRKELNIPSSRQRKQWALSNTNGQINSIDLPVIKE